MAQLTIRLWIEAEHLAEDVDDFCNVVIYVSTGDRYALNVWTFDYFAVARAEGELHASPAVKQLYLHPPDLFVEDLSRSTIEKVVVDILEGGRLPARCLMPDDIPDMDPTLRY